MQREITEKHCLLFQLHDVAGNIRVDTSFNTLGFSKFHIWMSVENLACTAHLACLWVLQEQGIDCCQDKIVYENQTIELF